MNQVNFIRIMILGCADAIITLPLNTAGLIIVSFQNKLDFWPGWTVVHSDFDIIPQISSDVWRDLIMTKISIEWSEWVYVGLSILFFALFGLTGDARRGYVRFFWSFMAFFGYKRPVEHDLSVVEFGPGFDETSGELTQ